MVSMDKETKETEVALKNPVTLSSKALFRYRVVSAVQALVLGGRSLAEAVRAVAREGQPRPDGRLRHVGERTVYRWMAAHKADGLEGLEPARRAHIEGSAVLRQELIGFLRAERKLDRDASVPELVGRARELGAVRRCELVSRITVWRAMRRLGLVTTRRKVQKRDSRRFQFSQRMQMLVSDFVHFRAGVQRLRRVACYALDDCTRFGLDVLVSAGTGEKTETFLEMLQRLLVQCGLMDALYTDGGSAYISDDTARVMANLKIAHIMGEARYPEGHGKIERFNQAVRRRTLRGLDGAPEVDPDPGSLTLRLRHDLGEIYNNTPHESLGGDTPRQRWHGCARDLRPVPDKSWLRSRFTLTDQRLVSNDHVISYNGVLYEVPRGLAGERIEVHRRLLEGTLHVLHEGRLIELRPLDPEKNATSPRAKKQDDAPEASRIKTASALSYEARFGSILDGDGGCQTKEDEK